MGRSPRILLSCGEASGDIYLAHLARALRERIPGVELVGVAGPLGQPELDELWLDSSELAVMGFGEVVGHLARLRKHAVRLADRARRERIDLFLPVDYPGWHMGVAESVRAAGIPVLDFIPPKTWSWGRWRRKRLKRAATRCAVIFPFEEAHYREVGIVADFVGHPLVDLHQSRLLGERVQGDGLLVVPGSRRQEILRILPPVVEALRRRGDSQSIRISRAPSMDRALLEELSEPLTDVEIVEGPLMPLLQSARSAIVTSGTATLEAALAGTPHLIVYRTSALSYFLARQLASVDHIGMANIVLGREAFPELLQEELHPARVVAGLEDLEKESSRSAQILASAELTDRLGAGGCFANTAELAAGLLGGAGV